MTIELPWNIEPPHLESSENTSEFKLKGRGIGPFREKYRPQIISEIVPTCSIELLKNQIDNPGASKVFLFEGKTGTGKTTCAKILAKASICLEQNSLNKPCLKCKNCLAYDLSFDKVELNASNQNKVDNVRDLIEDMRYGPAIFPRKIYILDEIHRYTKDAQNALLIELENAYHYLLIIFCTTDASALEQTLIDRTCRITFKEMTPAQSGKIIQQIASYEDLSIPEDMYEDFYYYSNGSIRALLNLLEAFKDSKGDYEFATYENDYVLADVKKLYNYITKGDWSSLSKILANPQTRKDAEALRIGLQNYFRGVLLRKPLNEALLLAKVLEEMNKNLNDDMISRYNNLILRCAKACSLFRKD